MEPQGSGGADRLQSRAGFERPITLQSSGGGPPFEEDGGQRPPANFTGWREAAPAAPLDSSSDEDVEPLADDDSDDDIDLESEMDVADALDDISESSSDASSVPSNDSDYEVLSLSPTNSINGGANDVEEEDDLGDDENPEPPINEWMLQDAYYHPGEPSGLVIMSPNELEVIVEVLGDAVVQGQRVTRYFLRIVENRTVPDGIQREE